MLFAIPNPEDSVSFLPAAYLEQQKPVSQLSETYMWHLDRRQDQLKVSNNPRSKRGGYHHQGGGSVLAVLVGMD